MPSSPLRRPFGLRSGEALGLQWPDVSFEHGTLSVRRALERSGGDRVARRPLLHERRALRQRLAAAPQRSVERRDIRRQLEAVRERLRPLASTLHFSEPKSVRSRRTIKMPQVVVAALKAHKTNQLRERLAAGADWDDRNLVFTTPIGTPLEARNVGRAFDGDAQGGGRAGRSVPRSPPRRGNAAVSSRRRRSDDDGDAGPFADQPDVERVPPTSFRALQVKQRRRWNAILAG